MSRGLGHIERPGRRAVATRLRVFLTLWPWYIWLSIGCFVFMMIIYAATKGFTEIDLWPLHVRIIVLCLYWIAILVGLTCIAKPGGVALAKVLLMGVLPEIEDRTDKAKEKLADSLMSVGNTIHSATLLGILVVPLTAFIQAIVSGKDPVSPLLAYLGTGGTAKWHGFLLGFLLGLLIMVPSMAASYMKRRALNLYDEISERSALSPALRWRPKSLR
jgi:hypothetical protein